MADDDLLVRRWISRSGLRKGHGRAEEILNESSEEASARHLDGWNKSGRDLAGAPRVTVASDLFEKGCARTRIWLT